MFFRNLTIFLLLLINITPITYGDAQKMRIVLIGPPGSGKGTQGELLAKFYSIPKISTGDLLRDRVSKTDALSKQISEIMNSGRLVPDDIVLELVKERVSQSDCTNGFILDGFPRNIKQAEELLKNKIEIDVVIEIDVDNEQIIKRLSGRRVHLQSGRTYHITSNPPKFPGKDDITDEPLIQRNDDTEETVKKRLDVYEKLTKPLIEWYKTKNIKYVRVEAVGSVKKIHDDLLLMLKSEFH